MRKEGDGGEGEKRRKKGRAKSAQKKHFVHLICRAAAAFKTHLLLVDDYSWIRTVTAIAILSPLPSSNPLCATALR